MSRATEEQNRRLLRARDAMDHADAEPLDVPALTRIAHVSEAATSSAAASSAPCSCLRTTGRPVTEVCLDVGFTSLGTFSRTFRDTVGESPSSYRRNRGIDLAAVPGCFARLSSIFALGPPAHDEATAEQVRDLVTEGAGGGWTGLQTDDCRRTCEELRAKGVESTEEPTERPYGVDCGLRDPFGNPIRTTQPAAAPVAGV